MSAYSRALAEALAGHGFRLCSGGTDNHLLLVDLRTFDADLTGDVLFIVGSVLFGVAAFASAVDAAGGAGGGGGAARRGARRGARARARACACARAPSTSSKIGETRSSTWAIPST